MSASSPSKYPAESAPDDVVLREQGIEEGFIERLRNLKYTFRHDVSDRAALERNFREKFESLNRVRLTDSEFHRLLDELITPDIFTAARVIREKNDFISGLSAYEQ
jgi:type I restriction enzyme R subunit